MVSMFSPETFRTYFFGNFTCIMVDVTSNTGEFWKEDHGPDFWRKVILGAFYVICHSLRVVSLAYCRSNPTIQVAAFMSAMQGCSKF